MVGVMPAPLDVDWPAIKLAFATGAKLAELSEAHDIPLGTLCARASREQWSIHRPQAKTEMHERALSASASIWQQRADEAREDWCAITGKVRKHLKDAPADAIIARADKLKAINEIERKNLGLDKDQGNTHLQVGIQLIGSNDAPIEAELTDFSSDSV
jgi:hypothetical protein